MINIITFVLNMIKVRITCNNLIGSQTACPGHYKDFVELPDDHKIVITLQLTVSEFVLAAINIHALRP